VPVPQHLTLRRSMIAPARDWRNRVRTYPPALLRLFSWFPLKPFSRLVNQKQHPPLQAATLLVYLRPFPWGSSSAVIRARQLRSMLSERILSVLLFFALLGIAQLPNPAPAHCRDVDGQSQPDNQQATNQKPNDNNSILRRSSVLPLPRAFPHIPIIRTTSAPCATPRVFGVPRLASTLLPSM
jgi:hypothetical protein